VPFGRTIDDTLSNLETPPVHMKSPWPMLDGMINGFAPGRLYIMGARPGVGKSVAALQIALELTRHGAVAFSSLEMTNGELQTRAIAQSLRINVGRLMMGRANADDWQKIARKRAAWIDLPLFIDDRSAVTMAQVKQHARNVNRQRKLAAVVVDYLQLISAPRGARMSRYELVSEISRELKLMAKELNVPVIALSQLNRETDGLPKLKDLRESGSLEQDADVVLFLHREMQEASQDLTMIVAKNRHGVCGSVDLTFLGQFSAITQPALEQEPEPNPMLGNPAIDFGAGD
jgi:replicative DNA helicase